MRYCCEDYFLFLFCMNYYFIACVCSYSISPCMIFNTPKILYNNLSIGHYRRRRYNRHDSSENRHAANGNGTGRAGSITSTTSASKRQKKTNNILNNNNNHISTHPNNTTHYHTNRSTSTPNHKVSTFVFFEVH